MHESPKVRRKNEYRYRSRGRKLHGVTRTGCVGRERIEERWRNKGKLAHGCVKKKKKEKSSVIAFRGARLEVITEIDAHRSNPSCSLYAGSHVRVSRLAVFVCMAPAGSSPTGPGNRFIGHPVHGI